MIVSLPNEMIRLITELCSPKRQASLAGSCHRLYDICNPILYKNDFEYHGSSAVFDAIVRCSDLAISLGTLRAAKTGGADFKQCQDFRDRIRSMPSPGGHMVVYSPINLAARRGLQPIVSFLLDNGISPDGPPGVTSTPLFESIHNRKESTAIFLLHRGASLDSGPPSIGAILYRAVQDGLPRLTELLVKANSVDINAPVGAGYTLFTLAIRYRRKEMIPHLIHLGAGVYAPLWDFCRNHAFAPLLWTLEAGNSALKSVLQIEEYYELISFVAMQKVIPAQRHHQEEALDRLLSLCMPAQSEQRQDGGLDTGVEVGMFLDSLLQHMLSIDHAGLNLASLLVRHGAKFQAGVFIGLLGILRSPEFDQDRIRVLRRHRKLLQRLEFVLVHCSDIDTSTHGVGFSWFMKRVPDEVMSLLAELKMQGLPLTARGLEKMKIAGSTSNGLPDKDTASGFLR
ncbi:hypothetical protein EDB80DRAFT_833875 [Ilyonectria destructans]|nr:hypothetical protein EDB80DRAFT_833875 [Ilyonectria destructans]